MKMELPAEMFQGGERETRNIRLPSKRTMLAVVTLIFLGGLWLAVMQEHGWLRPATVCQVVEGEMVCLHPSGGDGDVIYNLPWQH